MPCSFLQNGGFGRGSLNNICIASYGDGAKFFTTNLMSVDLLQNTPKTRKPIAERTSHRWLGCAVLPQNSQNTQNLAAWVWHGCHTLLICEHPCSSAGGSSLPEGSVRAFCGNIFFSHGWHGLTQMVGVRCSHTEFTEYTEFGSVGMAGMPYPPNLCASVGGSSLPEGSVCSVRSAGIYFLPRISQICTDTSQGVHLSPLGFAACQSKKCTNRAIGTICFVGAAETAAPPGLVACV